jgi:hypothetical protein
MELLRILSPLDESAKATPEHREARFSRAAPKPILVRSRRQRDAGWVFTGDAFDLRRWLGHVEPVLTSLVFDSSTAPQSEGLYDSAW